MWCTDIKKRPDLGLLYAYVIALSAEGQIVPGRVGGERDAQ